MNGEGYDDEFAARQPPIENPFYREFYPSFLLSPDSWRDFPKLAFSGVLKERGRKGGKERRNDRNEKPAALL